MTAQALDSFSFVSRRTTAVALIIGLHAVIIYGFATGLVQRAAVAITPPIVVIPVQPKAKDPPPQLPPPPALERQPVKIVESEITIDPVVDPVGVQVVTTNEIVERSRFTEALPPNRLKRVLGGPGKAFPNTEDFYPPAQIRMGIMGISTVQVCTDDKGRLTAAPTIAQTSGSAGLDEGALRLAKAGSGHYRATTEDGRSVASCYAFRVKFDFKKP